MENKELPKEKNVDQTSKPIDESALPIKKEVKGQSTINNNVDFSSIFNVDSEEQPQVEKTTPNNSGNLPVQPPEVAPITKPELPKKEKPKENIYNGQERVLYEIQPEKEGNPIVVVLFFVALLVVIIILPLISKKVSYVFFPGTTVTNTPTEETEDFYYFNKSSVRATIGDLEFTNFVKYKSTDKDEYYINFMVSNKAEKPYQFDKKYYVALYDEEKLLYRALIHSYEAIGSESISDVTAVISERSYNEADRFRIVEISPEQYPEINLEKEEGDYKVLTCTYNNDEMKYYFINDKLVKLKETYTEELENSPKYAKDLENYRELSAEYKKVDNLSSTFIEDGSSFSMINEFNHKDISDATLYNLKTYKFFKYNESKDVVSFELEAQGYNCS